MTIHWTALGVGFIVGVVAAFCRKGAGWGFNGMRFGPPKLGVMR